MIAITGATGLLGRLTLDALLQRGVPAHTIVALVRDLTKAADLTAQGIQVRHFDYHRRETLDAALDGVQKLLLISTSDFNDRVGQHRNVIEAAREAGVGLLAYTSGLNIDTSTMLRGVPGLHEVWSDGWWRPTTGQPRRYFVILVFPSSCYATAGIARTT